MTHAAALERVSLAAQQVGRRPYQYSQFCDLYASWLGQQRLSMRQTHRPGEKLFVDYSGKRPSVTDPLTGEQREVELYVAVLGASNYTFAEVTFSQTVPDFTASTVRALEYFGHRRSSSFPISFVAPLRGLTATTPISIRRSTIWLSTTTWS